MPRAARVQAVTGYRLTEVGDLTGGVDLRRALTQLRPARARRLVNWDISRPGELTVLPGWSTFSSTSLGSSRIQGSARIYLKRGGTNTFTAAAYSGSVYTPSDAGVWGSAVLTGLNSSNVVDFQHDRDLMAVFDGSNVPQKSGDGATWTQFGITAPASAPTLAAVAGGSLLTGSTYGVVYTYADAGDFVFESNGSTTATQAVSGANLTVRVTVTASADPQVDTIYVYAKNNTAGETVYRRAGSRANTNGTVDLTSENWTSALEVPSDHDVWPAIKFGAVWKNRWWGVDATTGNRLHFTQIFLPQAKPALFYIDLPFEQGDDIQGIATLGDTLIVWGARNTFLVIGQTSLDFEVRPSLGSVAGILGPRAWARVESGVIHAAHDGLYLFDGAQDRLLTQDIEAAWRHYTTGASAAVLYRTPCVYHQLRKMVRVGVTRAYPGTSAGEWILFLDRSQEQGLQAWGTTDRDVAGYLHWDGPETVVGSTGRLFTHPIGVGRFHEQSVGLSADGSDQTCVYEGPGLTTGVHTSRFIDTFGEFSPASGLLSLEVLVDENTVTTISLNSSVAGAVYGTAVYGTDVFASAGRRKWQKMLPLGAEGRTIQAVLQYTGQAAFTLFNYSFGVVPEPAPRGL